MRRRRRKPDKVEPCIPHLLEGEEPEHERLKLKGDLYEALWRIHKNILCSLNLRCL